MGRSKRKTTNETPLSDNNEIYLNLKVDMDAIKGKNRELVEKVARVQNEFALLQKQHNLLQAEYFALNSKYVNLKNIFSSVDSTIKKCFPKAVEVLNELTQIIRVCSVGARITNSGDLKTQTVSPHRVNGTVIQSPVITLARFSDVEPRPSTSRGFLFNQHTDENNVSNQENEGTSMDFINRRRRIGVTLAPLNMEDEEEDEETEDETVEESDVTGNDDYCHRLVTISEESGEDYHDLSPTSSQFTETVREIRIYLSPVKANTLGPNNSPEQFSLRTSSLSGEASTTMNENMILNGSPGSPNKSVRFSYSNRTNQKLSPFFMENSDWKNNGINSFTFTQSDTPRAESTASESSNNDSKYASKELTMQSLGLTSTASQQLATSTPVKPSPRTRLSRKSSTKDVTVIRNSESNITKKKRSGESNIAKVVIKRLNLDKSNTPISELNKIIEVTPLSSPKKVKRNRRRLLSNRSSSDSDTQVPKITTPKAKKEGKENKKVVSSIQVTKSSPRPKRNARPSSLREPSLHKKMRRSR